MTPSLYHLKSYLNLPTVLYGITDVACLVPKVNLSLGSKTHMKSFSTVFYLKHTEVPGLLVTLRL